MKTLGKLKLNQLHKDELTQREMEYLHGGGEPGNCICGCGGSSTVASNMDANMQKGYTTSIGTGDGNDGCACSGIENRASYLLPSTGGGCLCGCHTLDSTSSNLSMNRS